MVAFARDSRRRTRNHRDAGKHQMPRFGVRRIQRLFADILLECQRVLISVNRLDISWMESS